MVSHHSPLLLGYRSGLGPDILVDEVGVLGIVEVDLVWFSLPVSREDYHSLGLHFLCDLLADPLEDRVDGMLLVVLDVRLGEEICVSRMTLPAVWEAFVFSLFTNGVIIIV